MQSSTGSQSTDHNPQCSACKKIFTNEDFSLKQIYFLYDCFHAFHKKTGVCHPETWIQCQQGKCPGCDSQLKVRQNYRFISLLNVEKNCNKLNELEANLQFKKEHLAYRVYMIETAVNALKNEFQDFCEKRNSLFNFLVTTIKDLQESFYQFQEVADSKESSSYINVNENLQTSILNLLCVINEHIEQVINYNDSRLMKNLPVQELKMSTEITTYLETNHFQQDPVMFTMELKEKISFLDSLKAESNHFYPNLQHQTRYLDGKNNFVENVTFGSTINQLSELEAEITNLENEVNKIKTNVPSDPNARNQILSFKLSLFAKNEDKSDLINQNMNVV